MYTGKQGWFLFFMDAHQFFAQTYLRVIIDRHSLHRGTAFSPWGWPGSLCPLLQPTHVYPFHDTRLSCAFPLRLLSPGGIAEKRKGSTNEHEEDPECLAFPASPPCASTPVPTGSADSDQLWSRDGPARLVRPRLGYPGSAFHPTARPLGDRRQPANHPGPAGQARLAPSGGAVTGCGLLAVGPAQTLCPSGERGPRAACMDP